MIGINARNGQVVRSVQCSPVWVRLSKAVWICKECRIHTTCIEFESGSWVERESATHCQRLMSHESLAKLDSVAARARTNSTRMQPHVFMWSNFQYWVWDPQLVSVLYRIVRSRQDTPRVGQVCGLWGQCIIKNWDGASVLDGPISKVFIINSGFEKRKGKYLLPWLMIDMVWALVRRIIIIICK